MIIWLPLYGWNYGDTLLWIVDRVNLGIFLDTVQVFGKYLAWPVIG